MAHNNLTLTSTPGLFIFTGMGRPILPAIFLFLACVPAAAQSPAKAPSAKLAALSVTGSLRFSSDQIAPATGLHSGDPVTRDDFQIAADRLARLGPFANVQYRFKTEDSGVRLEFQVTDAPFLPVFFDNFPRFSDEELNAALKSAVVLYDGNAPEGGTILDKMADALEKLLATRGIDVTVSHAVVAAPVSEQRVQQFRLDGPVLRVADIQFSHPLANTDRGIRERLADLIGKPFSRSAIQAFEFEQVRPLYLSHAYLRVKFGLPIVLLTGDPTKPLPEEILVEAPIEPGPAYTWAGVAWSGNTVVSSVALDRYVELKRGEIADGVRISALWFRVREAYNKFGYLDADLNITRRFEDEAAQVSYAVSIVEGPQYHMGKLVLTGLSLEGERRIRNAWSIPPGAMFNDAVYYQFLSNGIRQALNGLPAHYEKVGPFLQKDLKTATVDVLIDFQ